jgi:hypothetical protein
MRVSSHFHAQHSRTKFLPLSLAFMRRVVLLRYDGKAEEQKYTEMAENFLP